MSSTQALSTTDKWFRAYQALDQSAGPDWMQSLRENAANQLSASGLPHRKIEEWKYTPLRRLESLELPTRAERDFPSVDAQFPAAIAEPSALVIDISDGALQYRQETPDGLTINSLAEGLGKYEGRLKSLCEATDLNGPGRAFAALNTAFLDQGLLIHAGADVKAGSILIRWAFAPSEAARLDNFRVFVLLDAGAELAVIEQFESTVGTENALNVITQAELGKGAVLEHVRVQLESDSSSLLTSTSIRQAADSRYTYSGFDLGGGLVRHEIDATLTGPGAHADIRGAFVLDGARYVDNHISVDHVSAGCTSKQFFRGVLGGRSRGVFNGRALIRAGADGSVVNQSNANLLLSGLAEMDTKPELEIYADEVEASHGATVGQLDEAAVFYLRSRGLSDAQARRMLTAAFCHAVTDQLEDRALAERLAILLDEAMPGETSVHGREG